MEVPPDGYISWTAELITAENAQQITGLFSCVDFVVSACLTIPDQYSIKEAFFAFSFSVSMQKEKKDPKDERKVERGSVACTVKLIHSEAQRLFKVRMRLERGRLTG